MGIRENIRLRRNLSIGAITVPEKTGIKREIELEWGRAVEVIHGFFGFTKEIILITCGNLLNDRGVYIV